MGTGLAPEFLQGNVSKIFRALKIGEWQHIPIEPYKKDSSNYMGITRRELVGKRGESTHFHVRYFEIEKGGYSTFETHDHEHVVIVLKGRGAVRLGAEVRQIGPGDLVYVSPGDPHQFLNPDGTEPFGFLCVVNSERDRPREVNGGGTCEICV